MSGSKDLQILRDLAKQYMEIANKPIQDERRDLWRRHNSLERTRPLVLVLPAGQAWAEIREVDGQCEDASYRNHERSLRRSIWQDSFGDDTIQEPWVALAASYVTPE